MLSRHSDINSDLRGNKSVASFEQFMLAAIPFLNSTNTSDIVLLTGKKPGKQRKMSITQASPFKPPSMNR
jgi:hypothetical protein